MFKSKPYIKSPVFIQNIILTARGGLYKFFRQGRMFRNIFNELETTQYMDETGLKDWQDNKLRLMVEHVYKNVPYYKRLFKELGVLPGDIKSAGDLKILPFLTKEELRKNPEDFLPVCVNRTMISKNFTSGSSGKPLKLYRDLYSINFENAVLWRQKQWAGIKFSDRIAVLREELIVPFDNKKPPFCRYSAFENKMFISSYHLGSENVKHYVKAMEDFKPLAIEAEPSSLYILARFIKDKGFCPLSFSVKAVFTSSEALLDKHKALIEEVFGGRVYDFYGNGERVAAIGTCEKGAYHVIPEYGITEFLPLDNNSGRAEIVGTNLHNYAMPLLRYRTGDVVEISDSKCGCGRKFQAVKKIEGRLADFLIAHNGELVYVDACYLMLQGVNNLMETQIIQEDLNNIRIKFIPGENFSKDDEEKLKSNVKMYMGDSVNVILENSREFLYDKSSKFRPFISNVSKLLWQK
jgi:phenylacetate-CoA ligase